MKIRNKYSKAIITSVVCTIVAAAIMVPFQVISNNAVEEKLADQLLTDIPAQLDEEVEVRKGLIREYDLEYQKDIASIKYVMETDGQAAFFEKLRSGDLASTIYLVARNGVIINGTDISCKGKRLKDLYPISEDEYQLLMTGEGYVNTAPHLTKDGELIKFFATDCEWGRLVSPSILKGRYATVYSMEMLGSLFGAADERLFIVPIDNSTLKIVTFRTEVGDLTGEPISVLALDESVTRVPSSGHSSTMGYGYRYRTVQYKSEILGDYTILALYTDAGAVPIGPLAILLATILLVTFLLQLYCMYIDEEPGKLQTRVSGFRPIGKRGFTVDTEKARIILPFSLICIVLVTVAGFYLNTLYIVANQGWTSRWNIEQLSESLSKIDKTYSDNFKAETEDIKEFLQVTAAVLEDNQKSLLECKDVSRLKKVRDRSGNFRQVEICNPWLSGLAKIESACDISVFDSDGQLIATSGTQRNLGFSRSDADFSAAFDVIDGVNESCQFISGDYFIVCVPFNLVRNGSYSDALLVSRFKADLIQGSSTANKLSGTFNSASESSNCNYIMTTASEEHRVIYAAESLSEVVADMPEEAFTHGYIGLRKVGGLQNLVVTCKVSGHKNDYMILSFTPCNDVYSGRFESTSSTFVVTLLVMLALLGILLVYGPGKAEKLRKEAENETEEKKSMTSVQLEKLNVTIKKTPTSSQRIMGIIKKIWLGILFVVTLVLIVGLTSKPTESLSAYLMSFTWQRGINIFSITTMFIIILSFGFIMRVLTKMMSVLGSALNASAETACQLLVSLLKYSGYITAIFITLYMFGVNTTGVLASLGAFSVMVGLGAQNLIKDILAGISIIMEKDYKVGDIVNIGGFCGKVTQIGIRTTKLEDIEGNVKIFYNSGVSGVVNLTSKPSSVRMDVKFDAQHPYEQVEEKMKEFFELIEGKYTQLKGECSYLGVQESTPAYNVFRICIPCDEEDRAPLRRSLTRELSEFCKNEELKKL